MLTNMIKMSTYNDIQRIIDKELPRYLYLPYKWAVRVGHEVYVKLLPQGRFQTTRRLINEAETSKLDLKHEDFLLSLVSYAKENESFLKLRGRYLTIEDIAKEFKTMGYTLTKVKRYMKALVEAGYIEEVAHEQTTADGAETETVTNYKLTSKTILPERPEEKFKVIAI